MLIKARLYNTIGKSSRPVDIGQSLLNRLVQPEKLLQLLPSHALVAHVLLFLLVLPVVLITEVVPVLVAVTLLEKVLCVVDVTLVFLLLLLLLTLVGRRGLREFDVVLDDLISENNALV
jgi:hypothetical protein